MLLVPLLVCIPVTQTVSVTAFWLFEDKEKKNNKSLVVIVFEGFAQRYCIISFFFLNVVLSQGTESEMESREIT